MSEYYEKTIQCPFCDARSLIEGLRERTVWAAKRFGQQLPANFDSLTDDQLMRLGHEQTYPGSVDMETLELKQSGHSTELCLMNQQV